MLSCFFSARSTLGRVLAPVGILAPALAQVQFEELGKRHLPTDTDYSVAVACCDVDGDGDEDLVFGNDGQSRLYLNDGRGAFTDATASRMPTVNDRTVAVACCDVDGDGDPDLVLGNYRQQNRLYLNNGTGTFTDATASRMPMDSDDTRAVACCDVDGDGDPDLVFGNSGASGGQNRLYLNDGTGTLTDATASRIPPDSDYTIAVLCCDVDGDGDSDLVFGNSGPLGGRNRLYLNDGTGTFTDATASRMPMDSDDTLAVACCDVDGDGDSDLVFGNGRVNHWQQNRLYLNNGTGMFTDATATHLPPVSDFTLAVACCDVDGDGDSDLVLGNYWQQNRLCLNDGSGTFTDATAFRMPTDSDFTVAVKCCDVDGDGDPDLVIGNGSAQQNRLYLNLLRQLDAPFLPRLGQSYRLDTYARYGPASLVDVALPFVSGATARIPLPPLGTLGLAPLSIVALPAFVIPQPARVGSVSVVVPNNPSLLGVAVYAQALVVQYPVQNRLTNVTADVILR